MVFSQNTDVGNCCHWQNGDINMTRMGLLYCLKAQISCGCGQEDCNVRNLKMRAHSGPDPS